MSLWVSWMVSLGLVGIIHAFILNGMLAQEAWLILAGLGSLTYLGPWPGFALHVSSFIRLAQACSHDEGERSKKKNKSKQGLLKSRLGLICHYFYYFLLGKASHKISSCSRVEKYLRLSMGRAAKANCKSYGLGRIGAFLKSIYHIAFTTQQHNTFYT